MAETDFAGKVVLVTGGSKGMGRACVARFLTGGAAVVAFANDAASLDDLRADMTDDGLICHEGDVTCLADLATARDRAVARFGRLDVLVCCAGIQRYGTAPETTEDLWNEVLGVNLKGLFLAAKAMIPAMQARRSGAVIAISSVQAMASQTGVAAYAASKGGINALVRAMALDHAAEGITVNAVCPASIDTPMLRWAAERFKGAGSADETLALWGRAHPVGRLGRAEEVAELVAFLASDKARFITGAEIKIDGGVMAKLGIVLPE
jgi:NAD(P)-dependent dehydrogenase (short-subunit alcohol dehydrogenase family)